MAITNSTIAQAVNDLVEYWDALNLEYATWLAGSVGGGPGLDGKYPLTDYLGNVRMTYCPAQLEDNVNSLVTGAQGYSDAAGASATAAAASAAAASTSAGEADSDRLAAQAAQTAAESAQSAAESARTTAIAQAGVATTKASEASASAAAALASENAAATSETNAATSESNAATSATNADLERQYAAEWANKAENVLVSAAAGGDQVDDYSAFHWAQKAEDFAAAADLLSTADEVITGNWSFDHASGLNIGAGIITAAKITNWDTAYGWGNHASAGYALLAGNTFSGNHTFNDGFQIGDSAGRVLVNDTGDGGTRLYMAGRNAGNTDWDWANEFGYDQANSRWYVDGAFYINGRSVGSTQIDNWNNAPILSTLTQADTYLYLNRNNISNPVLHVAQVGAGPIARFGKVPSLGSTGYTAEITFNNDGSITAEGLTSNDVIQTARLNIIGGTSGNTHFNWSSGGENYITHGSGDFTRFRGYDGVSTYTTKMQINDSSIVMSPGGNGYLEIQGSGYVINPTGLRLGQYTATVGYIQAPTGGSVSIWNATTAELARFDGSDTKVHIPQGTIELGKYATTSGGKLRITGTTANKVAELICTNGNLHIDSNPGQYVYLNYYSNTAGVYIGADGGFRSTAQRAGQYGAVETVGSKGGYGGISLDGNFALMNSGSAHVGLYDDINNEWLILAYPNSYVRLYHNGTATVQTTSTGARHSTQGAYYHNASSSYLSGQVTFSTSAASGGTSGDIWYQYT